MGQILVERPGNNQVLHYGGTDINFYKYNVEQQYFKGS
jgi:hypothetical protein